MKLTNSKIEILSPIKQEKINIENRIKALKRIQEIQFI